MRQDEIQMMLDWGAELPVIGSRNPRRSAFAVERDWTELSPVIGIRRGFDPIAPLVVSPPSVEQYSGKGVERPENVTACAYKDSDFLPITV
jgi:hypothetical protein